MVPRFASLLLALPLASALAACASAPPAAPSTPTALRALPSTAPTTAATSPAVAPASATPARTPAAASPVTRAAPKPATGDVTGPGSPALSVEPVGAQSIRITLAAPDAKAWRIAVAGTGAHAADRWDLTVETGDVAPAITTTETIGGASGEPVEQPTLEQGDGRGQVCATSLPVCVIARSIRLPADGNGTIVVELVRTDAAASLQVSASTAAWDGDPFVLGPWTTAEPFPWSA